MSIDRDPFGVGEVSKGFKQVAADALGVTARKYGKAADALSNKHAGARQVFSGALNDQRKYKEPNWERVGATHQMLRDARRADNVLRSRKRMQGLQAKAQARGKTYRRTAAAGAAAGGAAGAGGVYAQKKISKAWKLNRREAKKDAVNVGATGAAAGAGLGALSQQPLYRKKGGKLVPTGKFPVKATTKGALLVGGIGAASGAAANLSYKRKKKS